MRICLVSVLAVAALFIAVLGVPAFYLGAEGASSGLALNEIAIFVGEDVEMDESQFDQGKTGNANIDALGPTYGGCDRVKPLFPGSAPKTLRNQEVVDLSRWYKIRFNDNQTKIGIVASAYENLEEIDIAETIGRGAGGSTSGYYGTPNDPEFDSMWHLDEENDHDIDAPEAWEIETGDGDVIIAIITRIGVDRRELPLKRPFIAAAGIGVSKHVRRAGV